MRLFFVPAWIGTILVMLITIVSSGQCPPSRKWMADVVAIEQSDDAPSQKITSFATLRSGYLECYNKRDSIYARITHRLGDLYRTTGDFERGITLTREAIAVNKQNVPYAQPAFLAHSYYNLGLYFNLLNLTSESHQYFDSCIEIGSRYPQKAFIAQMAFEQKAFIYFKSGDFSNSVFTSDRGIAALKNSDPLSQALLLLQRAQALLELDRMAEAENDLSKSFELLQANGGEEFIPNANSVQAYLLSRKKKYDEAVIRYTKAFDTNQRAQNWEQCARDLQDLGMLYDHEMNLSSRALSCYRKAVSFTKITNDVYTRASLFANIGLVYFREKKFADALRSIQEALNTLPMQFVETDIRKNPDAEQLKRLANDYVGMMILANKAEALMEWYKVSGKDELLKQSLDVFLLVDFMIDQMRWNQSNAQSHVFWREKTRPWYQKALEICYLLNDSEHAFYFMEKSRAVLLNDKINEVNASSRLSAADYATEQQLRIRLVAAQQRLTTRGSKAVIQEVFLSQKAQHAFIADLAKKYPLYYQYRYDRTVPDLHEFRKDYLGSEKTLVSFFDADSILFALVVRPDSVLFKRIPIPDFEKDVSQFSTFLSSQVYINSNYRQYRKLAFKFYETLFKPLRIKTKSVIMLYDQYFIPMDALVSTGGDDVRYLVEDFDFSYAYSASFLSRIGKYKSDSTRLLGIAPVTFRRELKQTDLAGSDVSLKRIALERFDATLLLDEDATKTRFIAQLPDYDIVHLFSHAELNEGGEPVLFFRDSVLHVSDLQTLGKLNTSLMSLFACHTGAGKVVTGEGTFSLARGFAAAGIPATVTSMWALDNKAAYSLAELFYKHVAAGESTSRALQLAKIELLHSGNSEYSLPFFWAGTILLGPSQNFSGDKVSKSSGINLTLITIMGVTVLMIGIVIVLKRRSSRTSS